MLVQQPLGPGAAFLKLPHFSSRLRMTAEVEVVHPPFRTGKRGNVCAIHFVSFIRKAKISQVPLVSLPRIESCGHLAAKEMNIF